MTLTREDMLRELELLPAWKLNQPISLAPQVPAQAPVLQEMELQPAPESVQNTVPEIGRAHV